MNRAEFLKTGAASLLTVSAFAGPSDAAETPRMSTPIVFFDIAGPDTARHYAFYKDVFGWQAGPMGNIAVPTNPSPLMGNLRTDPAGVMVYMGVPNINATLARIVEHGGRISAPRFEVPGVVVLALFFDPSGNRLGLVEMDGDKAKIP